MLKKKEKALILSNTEQNEVKSTIGDNNQFNDNTHNGTSPDYT